MYLNVALDLAQENHPWLVTYITILKNDGVKVNGKDDIPYIISHMWIYPMKTYIN
jgi:hypothetical protein